MTAVTSSALAGVADGGARSRPRSASRRRQTLAWVLVAPALVLAVVFFVVPMVLLVGMSFANWPLLGRVSGAGVANYAQAFQDSAFWRSLVFSLLFTVVAVPLGMAVSYGAATMVRGEGRFVSFVRTAFFMPVVIGFTAAAYMANVLLVPGTGAINVLLRSIGITNGDTAWFTSPDTAFWAVIVLTVWKSMGVAMILLMAGMQAVPTEVIEASKIDGAGWWRREGSVVFPLVRRQFALCMLLAVSGSILVFDQFYVLTKGGPSGSTTTTVMYTYQQSFVRYDLGYGAALSMILTVIILAIAVVQLRALRSTGTEDDR
ncbi:carbohydrate ABC transporter membrane protein 1 (CUT1 family) [Curtobacterium sp. PhB137]|uniref:carbohydrate ABC transporter permease n=1 Tax=unclassified Curtobacterium TaxID=257496 RepID=UPI000F4DFA93|nr:sugar ABC transporter permease [Curtobacterium sp. PhB137]RPE76705.1 carbohydrate ABC transporter membrane protein 1 (CUT1 family) [Curtobacterium sp. PhB137]